ncbi:ATP-binding protein [Streptomyces sp. NPDC052236]|uniref:ATP-binding protein n=1 Tax=Streptomyces sp. NPDC052236 TaxID=3365686 RepID=UPI0037D884FF
MPRPLQELPHGFKVPAALEEVAAARRRVVEQARHLGVVVDDQMQGDLELLAGEVIANAVWHTAAPCVVGVQWNGQRLRVEVTDTGVDSCELRASQAGPEDESGRGLAIVDALATAWGTQLHSASSKTTWFELAARSAAQVSQSAITASSATTPARRVVFTCTDGFGSSAPVSAPVPISGRVLHRYEAA